MKRFLFLSFLLLSFNVFSQKIDSNMVQSSKLDCTLIPLNSAMYYQQYIEENKIDSAGLIINYWQNTCGKSEPIFRAKVLLSLIEKGCLDDSLQTDDAINNLILYSYRMDIEKYANYIEYDDNPSYFGYIPISKDYDSFTKQEAKILKNKFNSKSIEYAICEFYGGNTDSLSIRFQADSLKNTKLGKEYNKALRKYLNEPLFVVNFSSGAWIPTGMNMKNFGIHPDLGFLFGIQYKKMTYSIDWHTRFVNTQDSYLARRYKDSDPEKTKRFFCNYLGFDVKRNLIEDKRVELKAVCGLGLDFLEVFSSDNDEEYNGTLITSYNFNFGLGGIYKFNGFNLGVEAKYNIVDYTLGHHVDFKGNYFSLSFIVGGLFKTGDQTFLDGLGFFNTMITLL